MRNRTGNTVRLARFEFVWEKFDVELVREGSMLDGVEKKGLGFRVEKIVEEC